MPTQLNPYINFKDNTRQAMEFYQTVLGGKLDMNTFAEFHASQDPTEKDKIMHAMLVADNGITFMASDTPNSMEFKPGAKTTIMPLDKAPWGDTFVMLIDKFGIQWVININGKKLKQPERNDHAKNNSPFVV